MDVLSRQVFTVGKHFLKVSKSALQHISLSEKKKEEGLLQFLNARIW